MKVMINEFFVAESNRSIFLDGFYYFPKSDVHMAVLFESNHRTLCPWKGIANYFHFQEKENKLKNIAWCYPLCKEKAKPIENYIAFWEPAVVIDSDY